MAKIIGEAGRPYGHVPGHEYLDVEVLKRRSNFVLLVTWGSAQGRHDQEHGRSEYSRDTLPDLRDAALDGEGRRLGNRDSAEICQYIETAISRARGRGRPPEERVSRAGQLPRVRVTPALEADVHARAE